MDPAIARETVEALVLEIGRQRAQALTWRELAQAALDIAAEHHKLVLRQRETIIALREAHRRRGRGAAA